MNLAIARRNPNRFTRILSVRALVPADLEYMRQRSARVHIRYIREAHHNIARLAAAGLTNRAIAERLGYTESRISVLKADPSISELIATYRQEVTDSWREHIDAIHADATLAMKIGTRNIATRFEALDDNPDAIPLREVAAVTSDLMDRFGYGKRQTNLNINVDFAKRLEAAIARSSRPVLDLEKN
jgi:hypothetical protein